MTLGVIIDLLSDAKNKLTNSGSSKHNLTLPLKEGQEGLPPEGEAESTLEDYEKIPISDYGLALLRGMGWKEGIGIGKNPSRLQIYLYFTRSSTVSIMPIFLHRKTLKCRWLQIS